MNTEALIQEQINDPKSPIVLYMKGTPEEPLCGFSKLAATILQRCQVSFKSIDVLANPAIREVLPKVSQWPTFPQLYIKGELIGGSDIMADLYASGELQKQLASFQKAG